MEKLFLSLKGVFKISSITTENFIFRLHYNFTVKILLVFCLVVTSYQYIGDPISCISKDDIPTKVLDTFCWVHSTFSVDNAWERKIGVEVPYPGVGNYKPGDKKTYHAYYQWVCFMLCFQAILFYLPKYFWRTCEANRIKRLANELDNPLLYAKEDKSSKEKSDTKDIENNSTKTFNHIKDTSTIDVEKKSEAGNSVISSLANYLIEYRGKNGLYYGCYVISEALNVVNTIGQMYLIDTFLGNAFTTYGVRVMAFSEWEWELRYDPMIHVFPRLTKCTFHRYGSSGDIQVHDAMCILPINIINEKIYLFMWFWLLILSILSIGTLIFSLILLMSPGVRALELERMAKFSSRRVVQRVLRSSYAGDWFLLYLLSRNMDALYFRDLLEKLACTGKEGGFDFANLIEKNSGSIDGEEPRDKTDVDKKALCV